MKKYFQLLVFAVSLCFLLPQSSYGTGNDNPTGVTGEYNGSLDTGVDPYTGNGKRFVTDLTVTGSLGAYPLKWTRVLNTRYGGGPNHSYNWALWLRQYRSWEFFPDPYEGPDGAVTYPDGRRMELDVDEIGRYSQVSGAEPGDRLVPATEGVGNYDLILADGGRVEFRVNSPPPPETSYTLTATRIIDPHGLVTLLERDASHRLKKITEPGGRYLEITYHTYYDWVPWPAPGGTQSSDVISKVEAFARAGQLIEKVDYIYTTELVQGFTSRKLAHVNYADGAQATYTYYPIIASPPPGHTSGRMKTCDDPRVPGPMGKIEYDYLTVAENYNRPVAGGQVQRVKYPGSSTYISEVVYPEDIPLSAEPAEFVRTENRPNGTTRSFQYSNSGTPELLSYTDFKGQPSSITWSGGTLGYIRSVTDARGKTNSVEKETWIGAVKKITHGDGTYVSFAYTDDANPHYLLSKTDERGKVTSYERYPADHPNRHMIKRINYPDNGWESFDYNDFGQVIEHRMTSGGTEKFTYDLRGLKQTYTPPITPSNSTPWLNPTRYFYYLSGLHTDRLHRVVDPRGNATWYEYNERGQTTRVTHQDGKYTQSGYNRDDGTLLWTADENHPGAVNDPSQRIRYEYDEYKRVTKVTNLLNQYITNSYDPNPNPTVDLSLTHTTSSVYRTTSFMGKVTEYDYDANFRRTRTTQAVGTSDEATTTSTYDLVGNLETVTDPRLKVTTFGYDDRNRQTTVQDALDHITTTAYDDANNKMSVLRADGHSMQFPLYDEMNRLKQQIDERNYPSSMVYDFAGNLMSQTDERDKIYSYTYDHLNRKTRMTYPDGTHEDFLYDLAGNLSTYTNRSGAVQTFTYDNRNRQTRFTWNDNLTSWQDTAYDDASRVMQITNAVSTISHTYYDDNKLHTEEAWTSAFGDNVHRMVSYTYDDDGNRSTVQYPSGASFTYGYTERSQPKNIKITGQANPIVSYGYDFSGNLTGSTLDNGTSTVRTPDAVNRVTAIAHNLAAGGTKSFAYAYNAVNNITAVQRDGGQGDGFEYDYSRQITGFKQNGTVDLGAGTVNNPANHMYIGFDGCGNRTTLGNSNAALASYTYTVNDMNQYTAMIAGAVATPTATPTAPPGQTPTPPPGQTPTPPPGQTPTPPPGQTPTPPPQQVVMPAFNPYDGGIFHITQPRTVTLTTTTAGASMRYTFGDTPPTASYGTPIGSGGTVSVTPTEEGRTLNAIAFKTGWSDSEVHSATYYYEDENGNGPSQPQPGGSATYDPNGNLKGYNGWIYAYDAQNRLTSASKGATTAIYYYDGRNRQIARSIDGVKRVSVWDDWELIEEYASGNLRTAAYLQGARGPVKSLLNHIYYYQDSLGSTSHIANASGALLESYRYDLYGKPSYFDSTSQPLNSSTYNIVDLYAGERWVSELGLYDLRNRFLSPDLGRFLQADPIGFKGDRSNLYRYCHNDTVNFSDPMGLDSMEIEFRGTSIPQPQAGNVVSGHVHHGTLTWRRDSGSVWIIPVTSGGYRDKDSKVRGAETRIFDGKYFATHDLGDKGGNMKRDGVGYRIELVPKFKQDPRNYQTLLRIHPDGGTPGTQGCAGLATDAKWLKGFRQGFNEYVRKEGPIPVVVKTAEPPKPPQPIAQSRFLDLMYGGGSAGASGAPNHATGPL